MAKKGTFSGFFQEIKFAASIGNDHRRQRSRSRRPVLFRAFSASVSSDSCQGSGPELRRKTAGRGGEGE